MAAINKIEKYELGERCLELSVQGKTTTEIAEILTKEIEGKGRISQPTVSRWLKKVRAERKETANAILTDYLNTSLPADLKILDELSQFYLTIFRDKIADVLSHLDELVAKVATLPQLLKAKVVNIDEVKKVLEEMGQVRDEMHAALNIDLKTRMAAGDRLHGIVQTKLRWVGIEPEEEERPGYLSPEERKELEELTQMFAREKRKRLAEEESSQDEGNSE